MDQIQIHDEKTNRTLDKACLMATSKRVRRCKENRNIWLVGSGNPKTQKVFYCVMWDDDLDTFVCDCKSYQFENNPCVHVYACAIAEGTEKREE
jgi:hypothetical protein